LGGDRHVGGPVAINLIRYHKEGVWGEVQGQVWCQGWSMEWFLEQGLGWVIGGSGYIGLWVFLDPSGKGVKGHETYTTFSFIKERGKRNLERS